VPDRSPDVARPVFGGPVFGGTVFGGTVFGGTFAVFGNTVFGGTVRPAPEDATFTAGPTRAYIWGDHAVS
jgi:hypothetical protein